MPESEKEKLDRLGAEMEKYRPQLLSLVRRNLNPVLSRRISPEDVVQETFAAAGKRVDFFENAPEVPFYFKLRTVFFQTVRDLERRHLRSRKRDAYREIEVSEERDSSTPNVGWNMFADSVTSPLSAAAREDRYALLRQALAALGESDRAILELRHFDGLSNQECAEVLGIEQKNASIRYVRALKKLQRLLMEYTEFKK